MRSLAVLLIAPILAGCLDGSIPDAVLPSSLDEGAEGLGLALEAHGCSEAGGVTLNPTLGSNDGILPQPWVPADTTPYTGVSMEAGNVGVYHSAFECHEWTVNGDRSSHVSGGYVGMVVEPPPFEGVEPVDVNFLVATFVTRDANLKGVLDRAGWYSYDGLGHVNGGEVDGAWIVQAVLNTAGDGIYESDLVLQPDEDIEVVRLWFIVDGKDGILHPAYLDWIQSEGVRWTGNGYFQHTLNADHPGGVAAANVGGLGFSSVTRTARFEVLEEVVLEEMWDH